MLTGHHTILKQIVTSTFKIIDTDYKKAKIQLTIPVTMNIVKTETARPTEQLCPNILHSRKIRDLNFLTQEITCFFGQKARSGQHQGLTE